MTKMIFFLIAAFSAHVTFGQDKIVNDANAEARSIGAFHAIKISHGIELVLKQGGTDAVAVSAREKEDRDNIKTEVENGVLKIYYDTHWYKNWNSGGKKLKAYVSFKKIDMLHGSSGSSTMIDGSMNADNIRIELSSGAGFKGAVDAGSINIDGGSGATAHISGKTQTLSLEASSGAGIYGFDLVSDKCIADASSGGTIEVSVNKELSAEASSGGDVRYKGTAVITKVSTGSGGSVKKS